MIEGYTIVWSFRNRLEILKQSIITADENFPKDVNFCLVDADSSDETIKELRSFLNTIDDRKIRVCESAYRSSLSEAWNIGMMLSNTKYVIFASSDVEFYSKELYSDINTVMNMGQHKYLLVENHAVFVLDKTIIPMIGWFDEEFIPGPHFDCDYMIRASEANLPVGIIKNKYYTHYDTPEETIERTTSEVQDRLPMHDFTNDRVFKDKWQSNWEGWENFKHSVDKPHPPTHISQATRKKPEIDAHQMFSRKYE